MDWYYAIGGERTGPIGDEEFQSRVAAGTITPETLVWNPDLPDWRPWGQLQPPGLPAGATPGVFVAGQKQCIECGLMFAPADGVSFEDTFVCVGCKPVYFRRLKQGSELPGAVEFAGFWPRFCAKVVDNVLLWVTLFIVAEAVDTLMATLDASSFAADTIPFLGGNLITLAYSTIFLSRYGATPGKMVMGLKVVTAGLEPLSLGRAFGRSLAEWISYVVCFIGYLMVIFDAERRALHDHIANTRVIHTRGGH